MVSLVVSFERYPKGYSKDIYKGYTKDIYSNKMSFVKTPLENKFKNLSNQLLTKGLFWENRMSDDKGPAVYTLRRTDRVDGDRTLPSLHRLYVEMGDIGEYQFATTYLDSWDHWVTLRGQAWFQPFYAEWKAELMHKLRAEALARVKVEAASGGRSAFQANKYLIELADKKPDTGRGQRGRPKNNTIIEPELYEFMDEDHRRILEGELN